jgi:TonB family protein
MFLRVIIALFLIAACEYSLTQTSSLPSATTTGFPRVHLSEAAAASHLLKKPLPTYPPDAKQARVEGDVVFRILIGIDGRVTVLGTVSGNSMLRDAARRSVLQWQYDTYDRNGQISEVVTVARVQFRLPTEKEAPRQ